MQKRLCIVLPFSMKQLPEEALESAQECSFPNPTDNAPTYHHQTDTSVETHAIYPLANNAYDSI